MTELRVFLYVQIVRRNQTYGEASRFVCAR
jgi:hypothetical protein